jgi:hypothetical protein
MSNVLHLFLLPTWFEPSLITSSLYITRRWKKLLPHEVPLLQEARRIQKAALITNFVDRESERPALCTSDFLPLPLISSVSEPENVNPCSKRKGGLRYIVQTLI